MVSSFHVLEQEAADGALERSVRILYGEGDRYGCWLDVAADAIVWHELPGEGGLPSEKVGGGAAEQIPQHQAHVCTTLWNDTLNTPQKVSQHSSARPAQQPSGLSPLHCGFRRSMRLTVSNSCSAENKAQGLMLACHCTGGHPFPSSGCFGEGKVPPEGLASAWVAGRGTQRSRERQPGAGGSHQGHIHG